MSNLNNDLFNRQLRTDPNCPCGCLPQAAEHYLLRRINYHNIRAAAICTLPNNQIDTRARVYGDPNVQLRENEQIFLIVHDFINQSKRL